jgi:hypothetical protein
MGTPHLFIVDEQGVLHWGGDTRALAGRTINWNARCNVGLDALRAMPRGDPWLTAGLPKIGEPIYLAKWEDTEAQPRLLHIQSIPDVELFGINTANYLNFVMDRTTWEQRYGFDVGLLQVGPLASAASYAWSSTDQAAYAQLLVNMENVESAALFGARSAGADPAVVLPSLAECERQGLADFDSRRNAGAALAITQDCIRRLNPGGPSGAPRTPTNVRVTAISPTQLRVSWDDTPDETGYRIYGGDQLAPPTTLVTTVAMNVTSYDVGGRSQGVPYCYTVTAVNTAGESPASSPMCATTSSTGGIPSAPTNLRLTVLGNSVRLEWNDTSFNEEGFRILRNEQLISFVGANTTTYTDFTSLITQGCYRVVAYNTAGQGSSDQTCLGGGSVPSAPTNLRLTPVGGGNAIQLDWTDTSFNEDGFRVLRGGQLVTTLGPNATSFVDGGVVPGTGCYVVVAFNGAGQASSDQACPGGSANAPAAPTSLTVTPLGNVRRLDWVDNSSNEDGFRIFRGGQLVTTVGPNITSFTDGGIIPGTGCYVVVAYNGAGQSSSNQACQ